MLEQRIGPVHVPQRFQRGGGHPGPNDITNEFAENVASKLTKGIQAQMQSGRDDGSPAMKVKPEPGNT